VGCESTGELLIEQNAIRLRLTLQSLSAIDHFAERRVAATHARAQVSDQGLAAGQANALGKTG